jgi:hypothetical protein
MKSIKWHNLGDHRAGIIAWCHLRSTPFSWTITVGRSINMLLTFASIVIPGSSLHETHDQNFCSLSDMHFFNNEASSSVRERSVVLLRHYICCAIVSAQVFCAVMASKSLETPRTPCHCTIKHLYETYISFLSMQACAAVYALTYLTIQTEVSHLNDCRL